MRPSTTVHDREIAHQVIARALADALGEDPPDTDADSLATGALDALDAERSISSDRLFVHVVETGASFDNLFVFETERAADRFRAFRQMEGSDIDHGSTPVLDDAYVLAAVREDDFAIYLRERGVDLRNVPDDQILAMLDDMPEGFGPNADDTEWTQVHGPWLDGWAATFKGEGTE